MTDLDNLDPKIRAQYEALYGRFVAGDYHIGQKLRSRSGSGEVIWSYRKNGTGPLLYVLDNRTGWPIEVKANEVHG